MDFFDLFEDVAARLKHEPMTKRQQHELLARIAAAERERCAAICEQEICDCCWDESAQAAAVHLAAEIRKGPNTEVDRASGSGRTQS